ncbi:MAG: hypothetical protein DRI69_11125 [Bacteroidetes bacterium]|nr:MAG: hypothetical protein DRI69_11125 [Bacteroidota bacterium]
MTGIWVEASELKHAVSVLRKVDDEVVIQIDAYGLLSRCVDAGHALLVQVRISSRTEDTEHKRIGIDLDKVESILRRVEDTRYMQAQVGNAEVRFIHGIHAHSIQTRKLALLRKVPNWQNIEPEVTLKLSGKEFKGIIGNAKDMGDELAIRSYRGTTIQVLDLANRQETYHCDIPDRWVTSSDQEGDEVWSRYSTAYLQDIAEPMIEEDIVTWSFGTARPCEISYVRKGVQVAYILAPRIAD